MSVVELGFSPDFTRVVDLKLPLWINGFSSSNNKKKFGIKQFRSRCPTRFSEALPFDDNSFDYIVSNGVIHHTHEPEQAVCEIYRVLRPGGKASIAIYYRNWLLRNPFWLITRTLIPFFLKSMPGREKMFKAKTPKQFIKVYDGNDVPITKVYSRKEALALFNSFSILKLEPHYFPIRFIRGTKRGGWLHYLLDHYCGCMLYALLKKLLKT